MQSPWTCGPALTGDALREFRWRAVFDCCKWNGRVSPFPLLLCARAWKEIRETSLAMTQELLLAEAELLLRPDLHHYFGLPEDLRLVLANASCSPPTPGPVRVIRFDFHWTTDGWRISEANIDAASGFIESSGLTQLMQAHFPDSPACGDPAGVLGGQIANEIGRNATVGLMHLSVYSEDRQVMLYLAKRMQAVGLKTQLLSPLELAWDSERAEMDAEWYRGPLDMLFRFVPAEWVVQMPPETGWPRLAWGGETPVCNPLSAVLTQSKRFPLVWSQLPISVATVSDLLPETVALDEVARRGAAWRDNSDWIVKPALGHEGIRIGMHGVTTAEDWEEIEDGIQTAPQQWVAQRRFETLPLETPSGPAYPCLGVFVIGGQIAGAYGRMSSHPLIDDQASDVVVLLASRCS